MNIIKINKASLYEVPVKTTPENVREANEALFNCTMTLCCCKTLWYDTKRDETHIL